jgi:hypothetical protein
MRISPEHANTHYESQLQVARLQEENRKLGEDLIRAEDALSYLLATTDLKAAPQTARDKVREVFQARRKRGGIG